ncbi:hypothetical protein AAFC00_006606 [Neodothiora populina]|uniref:Uncharacterized protein n=1 Tax=Neodothiora populina TaxID=2781224 RepID=A0ABR3PAI4_9PEZI
MKTSIACISALSLATAVMAQPSGHRRHQHLHDKRDVVATVTDVVTNTMPDVIVYVDENGNILSSAISGQASTPTPSPYVDSAPAASYAAPTPSVEHAKVAVSSSVYIAPSSSSVYVAPSSSSSVYVAPSSSAPASSSSAAAPSSSSSASGPSGYGITYSPYMDDGNCKTTDQVAQDFESISGYGFVRTYGTDCNQVSTILSACKSKGMKLFLGIFDITQVSSDIQTIISAVGGDWDLIDTIAVGNEGVNNGKYTVDAVVAAIGTARSLLKSTGFGGKIVTVDTFVATIANPGLCEASDYAAVNCHPFFDGNVAAEDAGPWLLEQMNRVSSACGGKNTWITETGWPTQGETNGKAVPGKSQQSSAISSMKEKVSSNIIFFTAFNDFWKSDNAGTYGAEKYWGMFGSSKFSS